MANNFALDPSAVALWRFENGALTADSLGTNTLSMSATAPTADTGDFKEGAASAALLHASNRCFYITDANLSAGFPFKSGDTTKLATFAYWVKFNTLSGVYQEMLCKSLYNSTECLEIQIDTSNRFTIIYGTANTTQYVWNVFNPIAGHWYHITVAINGITGWVDLYVYDATGGTFTVYKNQLAAAAINLNTKNLIIGGYDGDTNTIEGKLDEFVVFNRILNINEAVAIRNGTFAGPLAAPANDFSGDANCLARYRFEPGALTTDSIGGLTLTASASSPTSDTNEFISGTGSASFAYASSQAYQLPADVSLPAGFPLKNGTTNRVFSIAGRTRTTYNSGWRELVSKRFMGSGKNSFEMGLNGLRLNIVVGDTASHFNVYDTGVDAPLNGWLSWVVSINGTSAMVTAFNHVTGQWYYYTVTISTITITDAAWCIGSSADLGGEFFGGQQDEIIFFNRAVSLFDATNIIKQTFTGAGYSGIGVGATGAEALYHDGQQIEIGAVGAQVVYLDPSSVQLGGVGVTVIYPTNFSYTTNIPLHLVPASTYGQFSSALPPANVRSETKVEAIPGPMTSLKSLTTVGTCPVVPPDNVRSLTTVGECPIVPPDPVRSLSKAGIIPVITMDDSRSLTICQPLLLAIPHLCSSKTKVKAIPPFNDGLFLVF